MKRGICPKCKSTIILRSKKGGWPGVHQLQVSAMDTALVECLICADCGFMELYVPKELDRRKMLRSFDRYGVDGTEPLDDVEL